MNLLASAPADAWTTPLHWAVGAALLALLAVHFRNRGRSGPIAALLFVLFGPVLGVGLVIFWILVGRRDPTSSDVFGLPFGQFVQALLLGALLAALLGALVHGYRIRDELRAYRELGPPGWRGRLKRGMGPSPALAALGLGPTASLEEVERAYRELAKRTHPDVGGNIEQFKRLQLVYEQAKRQAGRRRFGISRPVHPASGQEA